MALARSRVGSPTSVCAGDRTVHLMIEKKVCYLLVPSTPLTAFGAGGGGRAMCTQHEATPV